MKKLIFAAAVFASTAASAAAPNWVSLGAGSTGGKFFVDAANIDRVGDTVYFAVRQNWAKPTRGGAWSAIGREAASCSDYRRKPIQVYYYDANNRYISSSTDFQTEYATPGSMGEAEIKYACRVTAR